MPFLIRSVKSRDSKNESQPVSDQLELPLIPHKIDGEIVTQRQKDGYVNATAMCKVAGKLFADYSRLKSTEAFLSKLAADMGIPISEIIQALKGGPPAFQGTWVHPQVAIHLAQWLSQKFAVQVSKWVYDWMTGNKQPGGNLPYHLRRYVANANNVPAGHFSVLTEMAFALIVPLEIVGYKLPEELWSDISQGKMFAKYISDQIGLDTDKMPTYPHHFEDGRPPVNAKAYPIQLLHYFRDHLSEIWIPQRAESYFKEKDPSALPYLAKAIPHIKIKPVPKKLLPYEKQ